MKEMRNRSPANKRRAERMDVKGVAQLQEHGFFSSSEARDVKIFDISEYGVKVVSPSAIKDGKKVSLFFKKRDMIVSLEVKGNVCWVKPIRVRTGPFTIAGIKFAKPNKSAFERIATILITEKVQ